MRILHSELTDYPQLDIFTGDPDRPEVRYPPIEEVMGESLRQYPIRNMADDGRLTLMLGVHRGPCDRGGLAASVVLEPGERATVHTCPVCGAFEAVEKGPDSVRWPADPKGS